MPPMRRALALLLLAAPALAGCGGSPGDLLSVDRAGSIPGAHLRLVVTDGGTATCDGGADREMPDPLLLDARELQRELQDPARANLRLPPGPTSILRYDVRTTDGRVRFADDSPHRPAVLNRLALFVRQVAQQVCRRPR